MNIIYQKNTIEENISEPKLLVLPVYELKIDDKLRPILKETNIIQTDEVNIAHTNIIAQMIIDYLDLHKNYTEHLHVIFVNDNEEIAGIIQLSQAGRYSTPVPIKEMLISVLLSGCDKFYDLHNHPNNYPMLSDEDKKNVIEIRNAAKIIGLELLDSIIITPNGKWSSYNIEIKKEENKCKEE